MLPVQATPEPKSAAAAPKPDPAAALAEALRRAEQAAKEKRLGEAIGICQDVLDKHPKLPGALALLGSLVGMRGDVGQAIQLLQRACAINPNVPAWHNNLCSLYRMDCRLEDALRASEAALKLSPNHPSLLLNLAKVHMDRGDADMAVTRFLDVLAREPQNPEAHLAIGQILLARGEMRPGWLEYEWRNRLEQAKGMIPDMIRPEWNGMRLPGGTIMLVGDQGYGDTIQFSRYVEAVAPLCREVVLACGSELSPLLSRLPGVARCFSRWQDAPKHAVWCRLSSLGGIFDTVPDTIPSPAGYLSPDPALTAEWAARLETLVGCDRPRVGLVWQGRTTHPNDRRRSLRLDMLDPITAVPGVTFVSLQKPVPAQDAARMAQLGLVDLSAELTDFGVTAAVIANLDLVITVDSAVSHLTGALGRPGWVMMASPADWRWMLQRDDSPWYSSLRLLRQPEPGDWAPVVARAAERLGAMVSAPAELVPA